MRRCGPLAGVLIVWIGVGSLLFFVSSQGTAARLTDSATLGVEMNAATWPTAPLLPDESSVPESAAADPFNAQVPGTAQDANPSPSASGAPDLPQGEPSIADSSPPDVSTGTESSSGGSGDPTLDRSPSIEPQSAESAPAETATDPMAVVP